MPAQKLQWHEKPVLPLREAAEVLGISRSGIYRLQAAGKITFAHIGSKVVVKVPSIIAYLKSVDAWPVDGRCV
jgi:excisionase family DNA binding protein